MDDELYHHDQATLTRQFPSEQRKEAHLHRIWAALHADDVVNNRVEAEFLVCSPTADQGLTLSEVGRSGNWLDDELAHCLERAEKGDSASARRVAELLELNEQETEAVAWWHRAAEAGDQDAILYLKARNSA